MSIVNNGRISSADQKVNSKKYDSNFDQIKWKSRDEQSNQQPNREAKDR